jgi:hypothetical protein
LQPLVGKYIADDEVINLLTEIGAYTVACRDLTSPLGLSWLEKVDNVVNFWDLSKLHLPFWYKFATRCFLLQPSSACVERAFSMLKNIYNKSSVKMYESTAETTLMLQYNYRNRSLNLTCENVDGLLEHEDTFQD